MKVTTKYGVVSGVEQDGVQLFFGIPYAKAGRFEKPQKPDAWTGVLPCAHPRARCIQSKPAEPNPYFKEFYADSAYDLPMSEDCLNLNIRTPDIHGKAQVAVYIHGGGFGGGFNAEMEFDSNTLAQKGVVLVTINYRLNVFGFFASKELYEEQGTAGNFGILDQIAALQWVQENIADFGGDPDCVTIFGQSAGCMSVQTLASSPLARGLFHRAILQSGGGYQCGFHDDRPLARACEEGAELMELCGVKTLDELRALPAEKLFKANVKQGTLMFQRGAGLFLRPTVDGYVMPMGIDETVAQNALAQADYMIGSTENDLTCTPEQIASGEKAPIYRAAIAFSEKLEEQGRKPAYAYFFTRHLPGDSWGAFHSAELWYCFDSLDKCWRPMTDGDYKLADQMSSYWANFIKTGDPNGAGLPAWAPCTKQNPNAQELNIEGGNTDTCNGDDEKSAFDWSKTATAEELAGDAYTK